MTSLLSSATHQAHSLAASLLSGAQVKPGSTIPSEKVKENSAEQAAPLVLKGKNIIVGVPGAFTDPCGNHVHGYIQHYDKFKEKGVRDIYIVAVNDLFVLKAWRRSLVSQDTPVQFIADDAGSFTGSIGMLFDATQLLGGPRSKRYVIIANDDKVETVCVEEDASKRTTTAAENILALL